MVEPLDEVMRRLRKAGVVFTGPLIEDAGAGRFVSLQDLDGNALYLWQTSKHVANA